MVSNLSVSIAAEPLTHNGVPGVWFPNAKAEKLLDITKNKYPLALSTIDDQDKQINTLEDQVATATTALAIANDIAASRGEWGQAGWNAYRNLLKEHSSLWNQPLFWGIVGTLLGGAVAGGTCAVAGD